MFTSTRTLGGLFWVLVWLTQAQPPEAIVGFNEARSLYYRGIDGDKKAYKLADELFSQLYLKNGRMPRIQVYYGSLRLLEAAHSWALWKKNSLSKEGVRIMDRAVALQPDDLETRFVRAATSYYLPEFFHRKAQSRNDFAYLAQRAETATQDGKLDRRLAAATLYFHAEFLHEAGSKEAAIASWRKAIAIAPESRAARDSRDALSRAGS